MANIYDIHIQTLSAADQRQTFKFMSFGFEATIGVKGFQMLINMWLKCFLTPKGSDPTDLEYGTNFTYLIGSNIPVKDAQDVVGLAIEQCNDQIIAMQRSQSDLTTSERLSTAKIINYIEQPSAPGFTVYIEIQNLAGEQLVLNVPTFSTV